MSSSLTHRPFLARYRATSRAGNLDEVGTGADQPPHHNPHAVYAVRLTPKWAHVAAAYRQWPAGAEDAWAGQ